MKTPSLRALALALILACAFPIAASANVPATTIVYIHDAAGRLTGVNYGGASNTAFAYDADGSLLSRTSTINPFLPLAGIYNGLLTSGTPTALNTGLISIDATSSGMFTGTLVLDGKKYTLAGSFDPATGLAHVTAKPSSPAFTITVSLALDLTGSTSGVTGTIAGSETAAFSADPAPFNKKTFPLPGGLVGAYTALFPAAEFGPSIPQGTGYGLVTIGADGSIKLAGSLADGTKITEGAALTADETWPIYLLLYKNGGFLSGVVTFAADPGVNDFSGSAIWIKPANTAKIYPGAFNTAVNILGSKYTPPAKNQRVLDLTKTLPNAILIASGSNAVLITSPLADYITLSTANKVTGPPNDPVKLKLTITPKTGLIGGSFLDGTSTRPFGGVIFQSQNIGAGFFQGATQTGPITLLNNE